MTRKYSNANDSNVLIAAPIMPNIGSKTKLETIATINERKVKKNNNAVFYSATRRVYIKGVNDIFTVYPNPAVNKINIKGQFNGTIHIRLLDISGKTILLKTTTMANIAEIDLPKLPSGIYMLHINETVRKLAIR